MALVRFEPEDNLGVITIDSPPLNLADNPMFAALVDALDRAESSGVRALLVQAEGDHFGCGVNVKSTFVGLDGRAGRKMLSRGIEMVTRMETLNLPTVCAVQGLCLAAALEIALRCDVIVAAEDAKFAQVEQHIGAATFLGGAHLLAERCGPARAREICFSGEQYDAASFERWNIINRVVPRSALQSEAKRWAKRLADGPTMAHSATKRMIRAFLDQGVRAADAILLDLSPPIFDSADFKAGVDAVARLGSKNFRGTVSFTGK
ncbi:enoyl-CoA hydratase/isomerase family protein [Bradyrhizobium sp. USDA 4486]